jgi:hypothetical protein
MGVRRKDVPHCPYCVSDSVFKAMKVSENGRQIGESCGHIVFPADDVFWCPCQKCLKSRFAPRLKNLVLRTAKLGPASMPGGRSKR